MDTEPTIHRKFKFFCSSLNDDIGGLQLSIVR
ncbi:hypothetical protein AWB69_02043 [Caballeronia udeis]|uniref:Uncharacterized protein n=1 Tax=Caballeronia udeis TaxID=1232866 RepID=A0A158G568_9BURK|nr:hypothetical protein AWB69_02043 [Caballeronia udeis]